VAHVHGVAEIIAVQRTHNTSRFLLRVAGESPWLVVLARGAKAPWGANADVSRRMHVTAAPSMLRHAACRVTVPNLRVYYIQSFRFAVFAYYVER
jgi:hypothetical protein